MLRGRLNRRRGPPASGATHGAALTPAEVRILELLPTHLTLAQIAADLFISRNTAKSQVAAIHLKLFVTSRDEAVRRARETGLLPAQADGHGEPAPGNDQAQPLEGPTRVVAEGAEPESQAPVPSRPRRSSGQSLGAGAPEDSLTAGDQEVTGSDAVMAVTDGWAARKQAREVRARAYQARKRSFSLRTAHHGAEQGPTTSSEA